MLYPLMTFIIFCLSFYSLCNTLNSFKKNHKELQRKKNIFYFLLFICPRRTFFCSPFFFFRSFLLGLNVISVFRLWAEVFHVAASGAGQVKWQQVSEDLVPVNITCIQDSPECVFHITAYNSQVDKILDVRLVQPGEMK